MKIVYISHMHLRKDFPLENIGGIQRMSTQLLENLEAQKNLEIIPMLCYADREHMLVPAAMFWIRMMLILPGVIIRRQPDAIVFTSMVTANLAIPLRLFGIRTPLITINHGHDITMPAPWYQFLLRRITFPLLDGTISVSRATRQATLKRGVKNKKAVVIPNGMELGDWQNGRTKKEARKILQETFALPLKKDTKIMLTIGRQVRRKGHKWFIEEVLPQVKCNCMYLVIGDGPEHERIVRTMEKSTEKNRILILGRQPDSVVKLAYRAADVFIMPNIKVHNDMEGFGLVMIEANSSETPVIASDLEGIKDVIANGENGYRVKYKSAKAFAKRIDDVLSAEHKKLGENSRKYVEANFTWAPIAKKYIKEIDKFSEIKKKELFEQRKSMVKRFSFGKIDYEKVANWMARLAN
ncbi:glycosyltransferase family 4 protein [Candidatus Dojkabacteria bacterium]|nr:glycosyltransferase family 4 protein [Candidatus Dojkabacteria bacterium]